MAGVNLDPAEVDILENGGQVMALLDLPDPSAYQGGDWGMTDSSGRAVLVPVEVSCCPPGQPYASDYRGGQLTCSQWADGTFGNEWRRFPAYLGEMLLADSDRWGMHYTGWIEEIRPYRPWSCRPLLVQADYNVLEELREATRQRLDDCDWFTIDEIFYAESGGEIDIETACVELGLVKPPSDYKGGGGLADEADWEPQYLRALCTSFAELCDKRRYFGWSWDKADPSEFTTWEIGPMEDYLEPGSPAYDVWFSTVARRGASHSRIGSLYFKGNKRVFDYSERWIA
jgi:hypothetical protein